jgi:hypothetical protein
MKFLFVWCISSVLRNVDGSVSCCGVKGQFQVPAALLPGKESTVLGQKSEWLQSQYKRYGRKNPFNQKRRRT